jgi:hypothetical protein
MLAVASCAAASMFVAAPAHAATNPPVVINATGDSVSGRITVTYAADAGLADVVAHVVDPTDGAEVAVVDDFAFTGGSQQYGYWESTSPLVLPRLGNYRLDIGITDNDGTHVDQQSAGWFYSAVQLSFAGLKMTGQVTYANRDVTVSGQLLGTWPGGEVKPVANWPIEVMTYRGGPFDVVTDAHGKFKALATIQDVDEFVYLYSGTVEDQPFYYQAYSDLGSVTVTQAPTRITLNLDRKKVLAGQSVTVTGQATWKSPTGWQPVPNAYVVFSLCYPDGTNCNPSLGNTTADAQGRFTATVVPLETGTIQAGTHNSDPFITSNTVTRKPVTVLQLAQFTDFSALRDTPEQVTVEGHLDFPGPFTPGSIPVAIQFKAAGGSWQTVSTIDIANNPTNPEGISFTTSVASTSAGHWRATYAGRPDSFQSATSASVQLG